MKLKNFTLIGAALLLSAPVFGSTYFVGFEDTKGGDYDYNDMVFSLSGSGLTLNSTGSFYNKPVLGTSGTPFWNNASYDQPSGSYNVGYCIYGGGACNKGVALDPGAQFLASNPTSHTGSANDVTFSVNGNVNANVQVQVTAATNELGYYLTADPTHAFHALTGNSSNIYNFTPGGNFGLVEEVSNLGTTYYSQTALGSQDNVSHFAFFSTPAPEPGMMGLMGAGLVGISALLRRKKAAK